eukprot:6949511-Prymnesium_polylepis.1
MRRRRGGHCCGPVRPPPAHPAPSATHSLARTEPARDRLPAHTPAAPRDARPPLPPRSASPRVGAAPISAPAPPTSFCCARSLTRRAASAS